MTRPGDERETPIHLFNHLAKAVGGFGLDAAASVLNAKCLRFYTREHDGLQQYWAGLGPVWCNPPYSRIEPWVAKAWIEHQKTGTSSVLLLPASTGTRWWHRYVWNSLDTWRATSVVFLQDRLEYERGGKSQGRAVSQRRGLVRGVATRFPLADADGSAVTEPRLLHAHVQGHGIRLYCACGKRLVLDHPVVSTAELARLWKRQHVGPRCAPVDRSEYERLASRRAAR